MYTLGRMVAQGYRFGAPSQEAEEIDAQIAERYPCSVCGGPMHYEAYHKHNGRYTEYVALAVCNRCGHQVEF